MKIEFSTKRLALIRTNKAHELGLPIHVIKACREKLKAIEAAPDERTLRNWKSLYYKKIDGKPEGLRQVKINDQYRIRFILDQTTDPPTVTVTEIGDTH
jgi:toxin HigB-1